MHFCILFYFFFFAVHIQEYITSTQIQFVCCIMIKISVIMWLINIVITATVNICQVIIWWDNRQKIVQWTGNSIKLQLTYCVTKTLQACIDIYINTLHKLFICCGFIIICKLQIRFYLPAVYKCLGMQNSMYIVVNYGTLYIVLFMKNK